MTCRIRISFFATKSNRCPSRSDREILDDDVVEDDLGALVSALSPRCAGQGGGASGDARGWFAPSPRGVPGAGGSGERGSGSVRRSRNASYSSDLSGCVSDEEGMCDVLREVGASKQEGTHTTHRCQHPVAETHHRLTREVRPAHRERPHACAVLPSHISSCEILHLWPLLGASPGACSDVPVGGREGAPCCCEPLLSFFCDTKTHDGTVMRLLS